MNGAAPTPVPLDPGAASAYDARELARNAPGMGIRDDAPMVDMAAMREYRLVRLQAEIRARDCAALLLLDPINMRYAAGIKSGQIFVMHFLSRCVVVPAEGRAVVFGWGAGRGAWRPETVGRSLTMLPITYMESGTRRENRVASWARDVAALLREQGGGMRAALDVCDPSTIDALRAEGIEIVAGEPLVEHAGAVKCPEEIACMLHAVSVADAAMARMRRELQPGMTENELFAILHHTNIAMGGEWIEYRLLAAGGHANPWLMEAGDRMIRAGELVAFDCGLVGPFGYGADVSRTFYCEPGTPTGAQKRLYQLAYENIQHNLELVRAGVSFRELSEKGWMPPPEFVAHRYPVMMHGIGMGDEWPFIPWPIDWERDGCDGVLEENMVICVESFIGSERGGEGVKLEEQVVVTRNGYQLMSTFTFEERLLG